MKYFFNGKHVKTIPARFKDLNVALAISDYDKKRLQPDERCKLERMWVWATIQQELNQTRIGRFTLMALGEEEPVMAIRVILRNNKDYHVLETKSGKQIKVAESLYNKFPSKKLIRRNF